MIKVGAVSEKIDTSESHKTNECLARSILL